MNIIKVENNEALSEKAADMIEDTLNTKENPVLGLATGSTPERLYEILQKRCQDGKVSFKHATTFNLDEYIGLAGDDPNSYRQFMNEKLFNGIDIQKENTHIPNGVAEDPNKEAIDYEKELADAGKIDLQILGIGLNGHIGFNEPGSDVKSRTQVVDLAKSTIEANARFFDSMDEVPTEAITMGIGTIMEASKIILLVQGEKKAEILSKVLHGDVTSDVPASFLQMHKDVTIITDIDA
ncbi:MAG TPA: glucosamine-6-phosphate deaminase [Pseudogracilibacillus sp.]|nr:glucosamine-6-phosphate deaminase [Pseudogracilibacillus sp.]